MIQNSVTAYIAFGANLSNPRQTFMRVIEALGRRGIVIEAVSSLWRSPAWPTGSDAPDYINAVLRVRTDRRPEFLMQDLLEIETSMGRTRSVKNAPRTCDLDLIDWNGVIRDDPTCTLPHPRMQDRDFVLLPMAEIVADSWRHPVSGLTIRDMLTDLS